MIQVFEKLKQFIEESNSSNSSNHKLSILEKWKDDEDIKKCLYYTYNFFLKFNLTSENCKKRQDLTLPESRYTSLFDLLEDLNSRVISGHEAIQCLNRFVSDNESFEDLIWRIIDRNLKTRSTTTAINKIIPNLIPIFEVALAHPYTAGDSKRLPIHLGWFCSRKLDGVRCITVIDGNGDITFYSRKGNPFTTLFKIEEQIKQLGLRNMVLDGEMCVVDENGNENFTTIVSEIKRKRHTVSNPQYLLFDILSLVDFQNKSSKSIFSVRYQMLKDLIKKSYTRLKVVEQTRVESLEHLKQLQEQSTTLGWEGLMLRKDTTYKGKRSWDIMKVKTFQDAEYVVIGTENSVSRVIENGEEVEELMLKCVTINHKGSVVEVGSGWSLAQRRHYFLHPEEIIGKEITVQYFEETTNQNGGHSLRFPVFKAVYEGKRDF